MQRFISQRSKKQFAGTTIWRPLLKRGPAAVYTSILFLLILVTAAFVSSLWSRLSTTNSKPTTTVAAVSQKHSRGREKPRKRIQAPLNCTIGNQTCSTHYPTTFEVDEDDQDKTTSSKAVCPEYFRWIHEDLQPWKANGITRDMVERAKKTAHFRLVVMKGKAYVETYKKSIQTRDVFTIWGILQLLRRYPGRVPDLELMFDCDDLPVIRARDYRGWNMTGPPPLFRYCGDKWTEDIVFPDWSFWGWYVPAHRLFISCLMCGFAHATTHVQ